MKVKLNQAILDAEGKPMNAEREACILENGQLKKDGQGNYITIAYKTPGDKLTLKNVLINSLLWMEQGEKMSGNDKMKQYVLSKKVMNAKDETDFTAEEIILAKAAVAKLYNILITGRVSDLLDNKKE